MSKARRLRRLMNIWPPFLFSGIRVLHISDDWRSAHIALRRRWYNMNYVGTHFGGSLFSMTDPYWMILILECLGNEYIVWDKAAEIEFITPGKEDVFADFRVEESVLDEIREHTASGEKYLRWLPVEVKTASGELVARVRKQIYVRRKAGKTRLPE